MFYCYFGFAVLFMIFVYFGFFFIIIFKQLSQFGLCIPEISDLPVSTFVVLVLQGYSTIPSHREFFSK